MEMRKFNVEIRSDGRVYATEYEEPGERLFSVENEVSAERLDIRDALQKIDLECCTELAAAWRNHEKYAVDALDRVEMLIAMVLDSYWK